MRRRRRPRPAAPPPDGARPSTGHDGEVLAADWLGRHGHRILASNVRTRFGEIDLLVRRGRTVIAVEVKTRRLHPAPERCVDERQHRRIVAALRALAPTLRPPPRSLRVDVVAVSLSGSGDSEIRHFPGLPFPP